MLQNCDVVVIGAGPAGSCAAKMLVDKGLSVVVVEKATFPRFSIGESLLPQCMSFLQEAGLKEVVDQYGFQQKNGATFLRRGQLSEFEFSDKVTAGPSTTYQVKRAQFDQLLADAAGKAGADIRFRQQLLSLEQQEGQVALQIQDEDTGQSYQLDCQFVLDASGFGRVLPKMLGLEYPSAFPVRKALFGHIRDCLPGHVDRNKILIIVHPVYPDIWFWLIPFADGTSSLGVVGEQHYFDTDETKNNEQILWNFVHQTPDLAQLLTQAEVVSPVRDIVGYAANVTSLCGQRFALLGNAGEFLDPIFSSGVTIALKSVSLAAPLVLRELQGNHVDWESEYSVPLRKGINTFWQFVAKWYELPLQDIIFYPTPQPKVRQMICSILAGYAWDDSNPFVHDCERRLSVLAELCAP